MKNPVLKEAMGVVITYNGRDSHAQCRCRCCNAQWEVPATAVLDLHGVDMRYLGCPNGCNREV